MAQGGRPGEMFHLSELSNNSSGSEGDRGTTPPLGAGKMQDEYGFAVDVTEQRFYDEAAFLKGYQEQVKKQRKRWTPILKACNNEGEKLRRWMEKNRNTVKKMVRQGIPPDDRGLLWQVLCGARENMERSPSVYRNILEDHRGMTSEATEQIELDVYRTFPDNALFKKEKNIARLRRVLMAFSWRNPEVGYCQAFNFIAGMLLLHMKEEEAFWCLVQIAEVMLPDYYTTTMTGFRADQRVFNELIRERLPRMHKHMETLEIDLTAITAGWFLTLFVNVLPIETQLRVWDCFFHSGFKVLFRAGLALLKICEKDLLHAADFCSAYAILNDVPRRAYNCEELIHKCFDKTWLGRFSLQKIEAYRGQYRPMLVQESLMNERRRASRAARLERAERAAVETADPPRRSRASTCSTVVHTPIDAGPSRNQGSPSPHDSPPLTRPRRSSSRSSPVPAELRRTSSRGTPPTSPRGSPALGLAEQRSPGMLSPLSARAVLAHNHAAGVGGSSADSSDVDDEEEKQEAVAERRRGRSGSETTTTTEGCESSVNRSLEASGASLLGVSPGGRAVASSRVEGGRVGAVTGLGLSDSRARFARAASVPLVAVPGVSDSTHASPDGATPSRSDGALASDLVGSNGSGDSRPSSGRDGDGKNSCGSPDRASDGPVSPRESTQSTDGVKYGAYPARVHAAKFAGRPAKPPPRPEILASDPFDDISLPSPKRIQNGDGTLYYRVADILPTPPPPLSMPDGESSPVFSFTPPSAQATPHDPFANEPLSPVDPLSPPTSNSEAPLSPTSPIPSPTGGAVPDTKFRVSSPVGVPTPGPRPRDPHMKHRRQRSETTGGDLEASLGSMGSSPGQVTRVVSGNQLGPLGARGKRASYAPGIIPPPHESAKLVVTDADGRVPDDSAGSGVTRTGSNDEVERLVASYREARSGFEDVMRHADAGQRITGDILVFLRKAAELEAEFARKMSRLCASTLAPETRDTLMGARAVRPEDVGGSAGDGWRAFVKAVEARANVHAHAAVQLERTVHQLAAAPMDSMESLCQAAKARGTKLLKEQKECTEQFRKSKVAYERAMRDVQAASEAGDTLKLRLAKLAHRGEGTDEVAAKCEADYRTRVGALSRFQAYAESELPATLHDLEAVETTRVGLIKDILSRALGAFEAGVPTTTEVLRAGHQTVLAIDAKTDVATWIASRPPPAHPPPTVVFESWPDAHPPSRRRAATMATT